MLNIVNIYFYDISKYYFLYLINIEFFYFIKLVEFIKLVRVDDLNFKFF
jgi:hypothetical protein